MLLLSFFEVKMLRGYKRQLLYSGSIFVISTKVWKNTAFSNKSYWFGFMGAKEAYKYSWVIHRLAWLDNSRLDQESCASSRSSNKNNCTSVHRAEESAMFDLLCSNQQKCCNTVNCKWSPSMTVTVIPIFNVICAAQHKSHL